MVPWNEIIKDPKFADLPQSDQVMLRDEWFQTHISPLMREAKLPDHVIEEERQFALEKFDNGQGMVSSFLSSAGRGLATTATGAVAGAGVLLGSDALEQAGRGMTESVNEALPINTSLEKTNFAGNVTGNVAGFIAAGGTGGLIGKGLGGAAKGAEVASLGTGFLGGAASGAQEADQYQIAGPERYLRALGGGLTEVLTEKLPLTGGMGTELRAISRIPGLSAVAGKRTGSFIKDVASETGEEVASQLAGNAMTTALAPTGVETLGLLSGVGEAAAGGALGGGLFGGINLIRTPSERISDTSIAAAEAAGDTAQAAVLAEAKANAATLSPRLVPVEAPTLTEIAPPDPTLNDPLSPTPVEDLPPPPGFETPLPELLEPIAPTPFEETPAEAPITEAPITEAPITEAPITEAPIMEAPVAETVTPPATREEALTAKAEEVFPTPELPAEQQARLEEESRLIDKHGRISETEASQMIEAIRELGATTLPVVINDTGFNGTNAQYRGSIQTVDGQPTVFINRNMVNADTPIHEVIGHGVLPNLREANPDLFAQGVQLLQGSPLMEAVRSRYAEAGKPVEDERLLEETMATAYGNDSAKFWRQYAGNAKLVRAIKQWLAKVRVWVEDRLASKGIDPNMTVRQFNQKVTRRILAGQLREATRTEAPSAPVVETIAGEETTAPVEAPTAEAPAAPAPPARPSFTESLLADLPEKARAAWSESDLLAAEQFAAGDSGALERINGDIKRKRAVRHKGNLDANDGSVFSLPPQIDAEYMAAVESGDVQRQQELVDAAAKAAGYDTKAFHGTQADTFYVFDPSQGASHEKKDALAKFGSNFSADDVVAARFATGEAQNSRSRKIGRIVPVFLNLGRTTPVLPEKKAVKEFKKGGYDSISYTNEAPSETKGAKDKTAYVVADPSRIKSADPITRDDAGNVIPLSQRFKPASDDIRFSLPPPGDLKPSGLSANQRGPVRNLVTGIMYESETMEAAFDEAEAIYTRNKDFTFDQHFAALNGMFNAPIGTTLNMTPGAYWGLLSRSLTEMERNEDLPASERDAARRNNDRLAAMVAPIVAAGGQRIKGIDGGLKLANNPRMVVDLHDRLTPFDGSETRRNRFDAEKAAVTSVLDQVTLEELGKMAETALQGTLAAGLNDQIRGEHSADEGVATANEALEPAAEEAEAADFSWLQRAVDSLGAELHDAVTRQITWLRVRDMFNQEGEFSLDASSVDKEAAKLLAELKAQGLSRAAMAARMDAEIAAANKQIEGIKAKKPVAGTTQTQDLKGMVIGRLTEALDKLMTPASKKRKNAPTQEQIAAAISSAILAKSGLGPFPKGVSGDMALALGLLLKNQATAAEAIQDIHSALQLDPRTQDSITKEKLKAFMQLAIGKTFDTASGASEQAAPYGEKQIATVLRGEMKRLETSIREVAMDASLQRQTAAKLEAALRSPERGLDKILSLEALDATVAAVVAEFNKTAAQRAADMQRQADIKESNAAVREAAADARKKRQDTYRMRKLAREKAIADLKAKITAMTPGPARAAAQTQLDSLLTADQKAARDEARQARLDKQETEAALREAAAEAKNKKALAVRAMRNKRKVARAEIRKAKGLPEPLNFEEKQRLLGVKQEKIIDYLAREFGFDLTEIVAMARQEDRAASVQAMTLRLADALGLNPEQAEMFMKPVMAEAMKNIDAKRQKEVERRINDAIKRAGKRAERAKKVNQPTEAQKLVRLAMLGGLSAKNVEKLMLNDMGAEAFSDEFRAELERMIEKANDPNLPASSRAELTALYLQMIKSARGASALGLAGEWIMSNIFMAMNTFKVNLVWGGAKSFLDSAIYASTTAQAAVNPGGPRLPGLSKAVAKQAARTLGRDLQYQAAYILKTGKSPLTNDKLTQFSQSEMELITTMPQTEIRAWISGKPLSPAWQKSAKALSKLSRYTRRIMVSTDLLWRAQAYEMLKATAVAKVIVERGGEIPRNAKEWSKAIDDALYGGDFEQAKEDAYRQVDNEIASGAVPPEQRGIRFGEILDGKLGDNLGIDPDQRAAILNEASEEAKRWTVANETEGILGVLSNTVLAAVRDVPGLKFLLPAIRMPIGAFSQTLDWTPYGFARAKAIKWNEGRSSSVTNAIWNREGIKKSWPLPAHGVPSERAVDLRTKALLGSSMMLTMFIMALMDLDEDEDKADFYITGKGPENPQENKLWREKGNRPFMVRAGGVSFNYQESPIYAPLSIIGAWSDTQRYGKMDDTQSDKFAYLIQKVMTGFGEAAVLKNMQEALGSFTGGGSYTSSGAVDAAGKWTARTAGVLLFPRVGSEINTILFGPQDQKQIGWAGRALANVPFTPALFDKPALNFFGESIHTVRGDAWGEVAPILAHRISPVLTDDPQMQFVAKMKANPLSTTRRFTDGTQVMDDYDFVRLWAADSGKAIRAWLTPERMAAIERIRATDPEKATEVFDAELRRIRTESLQKLGKGRIQF